LKQLFIDLYLDEDVDVRVAGLVRARGFGATTTQEAGQLGNTDSQQLAFAAAHRRTLLTHNRVDFEALARQYSEEKGSHSGIMIAVRRKPQELARRILILLNSFTADEIENQVRYI
jgi:predicted nuclease of predicted toxin-antitoxin system